MHADATNGWVWSAGDCSTLMLDRFLCETAIGKQSYGKVRNWMFIFPDTGIGGLAVSRFKFTES